MHDILVDALKAQVIIACIVVGVGIARVGWHLTRVFRHYILLRSVNLARRLAYIVPFCLIDLLFRAREIKLSRQKSFISGSLLSSVLIETVCRLILD